MQYIYIYIQHSKSVAMLAQRCSKHLGIFGARSIWGTSIWGLRIMLMPQLAKPDQNRCRILHPPIAKPTGWIPKLRTTLQRTPQKAQQITTKRELGPDEEKLESWGATTPRRLVPPVIEHTPEKSESGGVVDIEKIPEPPQPLYQIVAPLSAARVTELKRQALEAKERELMFHEDLMNTTIERRQRRRVQGQEAGDQFAFRSWY